MPLTLAQALTRSRFPAPTIATMPVPAGTPVDPTTTGPTVAPPPGMGPPPPAVPGPAAAPSINIGPAPRSDALGKALMASALQGEKETGLEAVGSLAQLWAGSRINQRNLDAAKAQEEADKAAALAGYRSVADAAGGADPLVSALISSGNPDLAKIGIERLTTKPAGYGFTTVDGKIFRTDPTKGEVTPVYTAPATPETRPLTREERSAWGIAEDDPRPWAVDKTGKPILLDTTKPAAKATYVLPGDTEKRRAMGIPDSDTRSYVVGDDGVPKPIDPDLMSPEAIDQKAKLAEAGKATTNVNIDQKGETEEAKAKGKAVVDHFAKIAEDLPAADALLLSTQRLSELLSTTDTGPRAAFIDFVRSNTGIELAPDASNIQAVSSMVDYLTPRMRVPGSGATSDYEMRTFKAAIPGLLGTPDGNAIITATMGGLAQRRVAMASIAQDYLAGAVSAEEAIAKMRALPDPFVDFKSWMEKSGNTPKGATTPAPDAAGPAAPATPPKPFKWTPDGGLVPQ